MVVQRWVFVSEIDDDGGTDANFTTEDVVLEVETQILNKSGIPLARLLIIY